jgi:hypothetical protein
MAKTTESESTSAPQALIVNDYGFGRNPANPRAVAVAFTISNPNPGLAIKDTEYEIIASDRNGTTFRVDRGNIPLLLPGQKLGIAGVPLEDRVVHRIEAVQITDGDSEPSAPLPSFGTDRVKYLREDPLPFEFVSGLVVNPYNVPIKDLRFYAILRNAGGIIVGGAHGQINFVPANGRTGTMKLTTSSGGVTTVELYPALSSLSDLSPSGLRPDDAQDVSVSNERFSFSGRHVDYAFTLTNPNKEYNIGNVEYRLTAYSVDGTVIGVEEGRDGSIAPDSADDIEGIFHIQIQGAVVDKVDLQVLASDYWRR